MKKLLTGMMLGLLMMTSQTVFANWSDHFAAPGIIGPGTQLKPGQVLNTLAPILEYRQVGEITYIYVYEENAGMPVTLEEELNGTGRPIMVCRMTGSSLQIPDGLLQPGHNYYWYVESVYAPGTKSECIKHSLPLYFTTAKDAK